jgi:methionyl-tRNA formyltransferase
LNWVLINDEKKFGITVHFVDEGIDTGDIILQNLYEINDLDDYSTLLLRAHQYCAENLYTAIKSIQNQQNQRIKQSSIDENGFYCSMRKQGDEIINWNMSSREIFCFVRALCYPGPQAQSIHNGNIIKINKVEYIKDAPKYKGIPGAVLDICSDYILVKTGDSYIKIKEFSGYPTPKVGDRFR